MAAREPWDVHTQFFDAFNARDLDTLVSLHEPDAVLVTPQGVTVTGIEAIKKGLVAGLAAKRIFKHESQEVYQTGDIAVLDTRSTIVDTAADGTVTTRSSTSIEIVRRQADGTWQFVIDLPGR